MCYLLLTPYLPVNESIIHKAIIFSSFIVSLLFMIISFVINAIPLYIIYARERQKLYQVITKLLHTSLVYVMSNGIDTKNADFTSSTLSELWIGICFIYTSWKKVSLNAVWVADTYLNMVFLSKSCIGI